MKPRHRIIASAAIVSLLSMSVPGVEHAAQAQVGTDDDTSTYTFHRKDHGTVPADDSSDMLAPAGGGGRGQRITTGRGSMLQYYWTLGFVPVGEMRVFGRTAPAGYQAQTEYHDFSPHLGGWLRTLDLEAFPLRFQRRKMPLFPSNTAQAGQAFQGTTARTFRLATRPTSIAAHPADGRYLFYLASARLGDPSDWIDHYLLMSFDDDSPIPTLRWFVDARAFARLRPEMGADWRTDERWAVRPLDDGLLSPIDEAVGYEMIPKPTRLQEVARRSSKATTAR